MLDGYIDVGVRRMNRYHNITYVFPWIIHNILIHDPFEYTYLFMSIIFYLNFFFCVDLQFLVN